MQLLVRRWLYALLLGATLATQTLGLVHQVLHQAEAPGRAAVHGAFEDTFALDEDGVTCALFDQLAQGGAAATPLAAFDAAEPAQPRAQVVAHERSGGAAAFHARAPPAA